MESSTSDPSAPSVPSDLLFLFGSSDLSHPSPKSVGLPSHSTSSFIPDSETVFPLVIRPSASPAPWSSLFKPAAQNLSKLATPTFHEEGIRATDSIILGSSQIWKDYLIAYFHGSPPSPAKIFSDLNPVWGKQGKL